MSLGKPIHSVLFMAQHHKMGTDSGKKSNCNERGVTKSTFKIPQSIPTEVSLFAFIVPVFDLDQCRHFQIKPRADEC